MSKPPVAKAWRDRLKAAGKCTQCGEPNDALPKVRCNACLEKVRERSNRENRALKLEVIAGYGGRCAGLRTTGQCAENDVDILEIDHIHGGGNRQRIETGLRGVNFYRRLRRDGYPEGFRVLCRNCNWLSHLKRLVN